MKSIISQVLMFFVGLFISKVFGLSTAIGFVAGIIFGVVVVLFVFPSSDGKQ